MNGYQVEDREPWHRSYLWRLSLALLGIVAFVAVAIAFENEVGIPFALTYRIACSAICLLFIYKLGSDYSRERWPKIGLLLALMVNVAIFFTPLVKGPASRGEVMLFALPDAIVVLVARIATYRVVDVHQRAVRQTMVLGLIAAIAFCAILFTLVLLGSHGAR